MSFWDAMLTAFVVTFMWAGLGYALWTIATAEEWPKQKGDD